MQQRQDYYSIIKIKLLCFNTLRHKKIVLDTLIVAYYMQI